MKSWKNKNLKQQIEFLEMEKKKLSDQIASFETKYQQLFNNKENLNLLHEAKKGKFALYNPDSSFLIKNQAWNIKLLHDINTTQPNFKSQCKI